MTRVGAVLLALAVATSAEAAVVKLPVKDDPTISFRLWFRVGSQDDPPGKEGLASITAALLARGSTRNNPYARVKDKLFPLASSYDATTSVEMTVFAGRTHRDNLEEYYPLLLDAVLRPAFAQEDLDRILGERLSYLQKTLRYAGDEELGKAALYNAIFAGTPYGHLVEGTVAGVKSITLDDVRAFYREHFTRDTLTIGLGGGYPPALVARLEHDLGALPAGSPPRPPAPAPHAGPGVTIVEKDAASTAISMGFPIDVLRGSKEWYALAIANSYLGEHRQSSGRLYQSIREQRGLNYGDYSYIEHVPRAGGVGKPVANAGRRRQIFEIWIRPVPSEARLFAARAALRELGRLVEHGMTAEDFERTRSFLKKYVLQYATTTMDRLAWALDDRFYGIEGSHLERFRKMMDEVTLADVNAAIRKHLRSRDLRIVFVTKDGASLAAQLASGAPSPIQYPTPKPADLVAEDKEIAAYPIAAPPAVIVPVEELF